MDSINKIIKRLFLFFGAMFVLLVFAIRLIPDSSGSVHVRNKSSSLIKRVDIEVCGQKFSINNLEQGKEQLIFHKISGDSGYHVTVEFESGKKVSGEFGYVTDFLESENDVEISDNNISFDFIKPK